MIRYIAWAGIALAAAATAAAQTPDFSALEQRVQREIGNGNLPSLAIAVTQDGRIVYSRAFGNADLAQQRPASVHTAYALASATKPITATAVLQLAERGKLELDAPASHYLRPWRLQRSREWPEPRVTQLLDHTAGLATYAQIHYGDDIADAPTLARSVERYGRLVQPPGRVAEYSNLGYGLLGRIVEQRSGLRFGDYLKRNVFEPLGMVNAFVDVPASNDADVATPYDAQNQALPRLHNDTPGAGNAYASAEDLIRFAQFHLDPAHAKSPVLSADSVRRMQRNADANALHHYYAGAYYGLGWYVRRDDGGQRMVWHEGGMPGASTIIKLLPERRIGVVVLANKTEVNAITQAVADDALHALLPAYTPGALDATANYVPYTDQSTFRGRWHGDIAVDGKSLACEIEFGTSGSATIAFAPKPGSKERERGEFRGIVYGDSFVGAVPLALPIPAQAGRANPLLLVKLLRSGDVLQGSLVAYASPQRLEYLLPFAVRLKPVR